MPKTLLRFEELAAPEGSCYVDLAEIAAVGPPMAETLAGQFRRLRVLFLKGGQSLVVMDTADNMSLIFDTSHAWPS